LHFAKQQIHLPPHPPCPNIALDALIGMHKKVKKNFFNYKIFQLQHRNVTRFSMSHFQENMEAVLHYTSSICA